MMTLDSNILTKPSHNNQSSGSGKTGCLKPPEQGLKCPRCDSPNTKFCYYNNYSLSQPRHFCKTCRRYWTNGGALRNIPIGGGCRKHKKIKSNSGLFYDSKDTPSSSYETSSLKDLHGGSPSTEFQLGRHPFSRLSSSITSNVYNQFPSAIGTNNPACFHIDPSVNSSSLLAFDYHGSPNFKQEETWSLASSIESLSVINQDLHWRLQQQRLAEMLSEENHKKVSDATPQDQLQEPEPFLFENHEISEPEARVAGNTRKSGSVNGNITTEWFINTTNSINNGENITSNWSGIQAWGDLHQYGVLPQ